MTAKARKATEQTIQWRDEVRREVAGYRIIHHEPIGWRDGMFLCRPINGEAIYISRRYQVMYVLRGRRWVPTLEINEENQCKRLARARKGGKR